MDDRTPAKPIDALRFFPRLRVSLLSAPQLSAAFSRRGLLESSGHIMHITRWVRERVK